MPNADGGSRRACVILLPIFAAIVFASHFPFLSLPYYWDELGQFIPAALDILHEGAWIPHSTVPNIHPPGVMAYLATTWRVAGFHPATTRCAMLALAAVALWAAFRLALELGGESRWGLGWLTAWLTAMMLAVSPLFVAQSMLAQLDAPAMLFSTLAVLFFLRERIGLSAAMCVALVLVKETGAVVPLVLAAWLARERRWRDAALYLAPAVALAGWVGALAARTGHWSGNAEFARYNLYEPLQPARLAAALLRRVYSLLFANFHWIGAAAVVYAWRTSEIFNTRAWRLAGSLVAAHVVMFTISGGAVLERYLLPVMPIVYAAMATAIWRLGQTRAIACGVAMLAGLAAGNFVNPPYPFPLEDNLAFVDYLKTHQDAAEYLERFQGRARVLTMWPMTAELSRPEFGFVEKGVAVALLTDLAPETLGSLDWRGVEVLVAFSRDTPVAGFWRHFVPLRPAATRDEVREHVPFPTAARFERRGQWVDIYVRPGL